MDIRFKPVSVEDLPMLKRWMENQHWRDWWGEPDNELGNICDMIEGKDTTCPFIFFVDDEPAGYIQYWHVGHHQNPSWISQNPWLKDLPREAIGVDLSIGESSKLSKGIGPAVLKKFTTALLALGHETILIDPDPVNHRAVKAYEKAGFRKIAAYNKNTSDCVIMQYQSS
ncbi:MAG: GNAT family N-acetyltransferase [Salaquimonas sp.]